MPWPASILAGIAWITFFSTSAAEAEPVLTDVGVRALVSDAQWCSDTLASWQLADRSEFGFYDVEAGAQPPLVDPELGAVTRYHCGADALFAITAKELVKYRLSDRKVAYRLPLNDFNRAMRDENAAHRQALGLPDRPDACVIDLVTGDGREALPPAVREDKDICVITNLYDFYEGDDPPDDQTFLVGRYFVLEPLEDGVVLRLSSVGGPDTFINVGECPGQVPCLERDMTLDMVALDANGSAKKLLKRTTLSAIVEPVLQQNADRRFLWIDIAQFTARRSIILLIHSVETLLTCEVTLDPMLAQCGTFTEPAAESGFSPVAIRTAPASASSVLERAFDSKIGLLFYSKDQLCISAAEMAGVCPLKSGDWHASWPDTLGYGNFVVRKEGEMLRAIYGQVSTPQEGPVASMDVDRLYIVNAPLSAP